MPGRINALELMPGRIGQISALALMPGRIQWKNESIHLYKYNILLKHKITKLYNEADVDLASKSTGFIKLLHFWVFQYFLSSKSPFWIYPQTGQIQF